jgi:hypothetical protein
LIRLPAKRATRKRHICSRLSGGTARTACTWLVYFDKYRDHSYGVVSSKDLKNWTDVSDKLEFPKDSRHGTIVQVSNSVLDKLMGKTQAALPNVLIIGDSISIGYFPVVKELLEGKAVVVHNPGNAQHTRFGLEKLDEWLGQTKWDVIHFNEAGSRVLGEQVAAAILKGLER